MQVLSSVRLPGGQANGEQLECVLPGLGLKKPYTHLLLCNNYVIVRATTLLRTKNNILHYALPLVLNMNFLLED
jgi:hypothetical protein